MSEIVKLYNPANAAALTPEQIQGLQSLTTDQLKELATAYPNSGKAYLLIIDGRMPAGKQLPSLSTFQNLYNLRARNAQKHWVAFNFQGIYKPVVVNNVRPRKTEVRDMSDVELMSLPGLPGVKTFVGKQSGFKMQPLASENTVAIQDLTNDPPKTNFTVNTEKKKMGRPPKNKQNA